jgi:hypothetical protein
MTIANQLKAAENVPVLSTESYQPSPRLTFGLRPIFIGPNGLRAGWRLAHVPRSCLPFYLEVSFSSAAGGPQSFQEKYKNQSHITITPLVMGELRSDHLAVSLRRCLDHEQTRASQIQRIWFTPAPRPEEGFLDRLCLTGLLTISGTLLTIFLLHGFHITGLALHGTAILSSLLGWAIAFLFAGLVEEFLFRGYIQYTLASGIGFWPAAFLMSGLFGFGHFFNPNETVQSAQPRLCCSGFSSAFSCGGPEIYGVRSAFI